MTYTPTDSGLSAVAKMLPTEALKQWCDSANEAQAMGLDHNGCVKAAWAEVGKTWEKPADAKPWPNVSKWVRKDSPTCGDVHVDAPLGSDGKKKKPKMPADMMKAEDTAAIVKVGSDESRMAYGWASVISENGEPVVDTQDDVISADELEKATTDFMADARTAKAMHDGDGIGEVLHSFPLTAELAKSLGISADREGWIVGVKVHDDNVWKAVKDGTFRAFSIGGHSRRVPI